MPEFNYRKCIRLLRKHIKNTVHLPRRSSNRAIEGHVLWCARQFVKSMSLAEKKQLSEADEVPGWIGPEQVADLFQGGPDLGLT